MAKEATDKEGTERDSRLKRAPFGNEVFPGVRDLRASSLLRLSQISS